MIPLCGIIMLIGMYDDATLQHHNNISSAPDRANKANCQREVKLSKPAKKRKSKPSEKAQYPQAKVSSQAPTNQPTNQPTNHNQTNQASKAKQISQAKQASQQANQAKIPLLPM